MLFHKQMASFGLFSSPTLDCVEVPHFSFNSPTTLMRPACLPLFGRTANPLLASWSRTRCLFSRSTQVSPLESEQSATMISSDSVEKEDDDDDDLSHVIKFKLSDFEVSDRVSIGLGGRADETVFEAIVKDAHSPLHNTRVVLRRLTSAQAQRRGKRAIQVLKKLAPPWQFFFEALASTGRLASNIRSTLALDDGSVRRVGDDTVGGPAVSRQLRLIRIVMRDLLIGVNYLHSHGLAHTELRLENVHISPVDKHIKVGIFGNAADFCEDNPNNSIVDSNTHWQQMMIAFDMRCLGFIMAKMVLRELMDPSIFTEFK